MSRSFLAHTALSSAAVAAVLLTGCDPICTDGVSRPGQGKVTRNAAGTCVQLVTFSPDAGAEGGPDGGEFPDASTDWGECGGTAPGWTTRVLDEGVDSVTEAFVFDARGVGHYAYSKGTHVYVGTTLPEGGPVQAGDVWAAYSTHMAVGADGTHHLLVQQQDSVAYAHDTGGVWRSEVVGKGWAAAIALDAQGAPHLLIGQTTAAQGYLHGTRTAEGTWTLTPLETAGGRGERERMKLDAAGHLHAVFLRAQGALSQVVYATDMSGTWTVEPLDFWVPMNSPLLRVALELDAAGHPRLLASTEQGAWLWVKDGGTWTRQGLGAFLSRGPALAMGPGNLSWALLDDAETYAADNGSPSQLVVKSLYGQSPVGSTAPLTVESLDGGTAFPSNSAVHVDAQDRIQVGFTYVHYHRPPDGGTVTTRGLRYARYCP
ncbi:hypothetical protein D7W79_40140 [Corallococcus exercitus]|uniref:hypothetical protein n=1 Tax=Corallococcus exercitus TaxID=2316736 RepID=UPI000EA13624|nr:hypothetical protein [Corallococcus exercitus]RKG63545.1 hypothetical protein D7W79_40140 [Corallococcus exercitus]